MSPEPVITKALQEVEPGSHSTLPTGRIKLEGGKLYQEALIIVHKPGKHGDVGLRHDWILIPDEIMEWMRMK